MHTTDDALLRRMLGIQEDQDPLPDLVREVEIRTRMFHACGASGPLGALALVDAARHKGFGLKPADPAPARIDWRSKRLGTPVEAKFFGEWMPGTYLGYCGSGTIQVRLDGESMVKEIYPTNVRLAPDPVSEQPDEPAGPIDWETVAEGDGFLLTENGQVKDVIFVQLDAPGVRVLVEGEEEARVVSFESLSR
jgi:hypothetical protein